MKFGKFLIRLFLSPIIIFICVSLGIIVGIIATLMFIVDPVAFKDAVGI